MQLIVVTATSVHPPQKFLLRAQELFENVPQLGLLNVPSLLPRERDNEQARVTAPAFR